MSQLGITVRNKIIQVVIKINLVGTFNTCNIRLFRLQTPATPLFRPVHHDNILLDDFPMGTNAIVAVISYTVSTVLSEKCILIRFNRLRNYCAAPIPLYTLSRPQIQSQLNFINQFNDILCKQLSKQ